MIDCCKVLNIFKVYSLTIFLLVLLVIGNLFGYNFLLTVLIVLMDIWHFHILETIDYQ